MSDLNRESSDGPGGLAQAVRDLLHRLFSPRVPVVPVSTPSRPTRAGAVPVADRPRSRIAPASRPSAGDRPAAARLRRTSEAIPGMADLDAAGPWASAVVDPPRVFHPTLAPTTRTYEMSQLAVLDRRLTDSPAPHPVTAAHLGLGLGHKMPDHAVLVALRWDGPPEYPYVHGQFSAGEEAIVTDLDAAALREISRLLGLRQVWID